MTSIYWFRKSLRVHDNQGLLKLSNPQNAKFVLPIFILDPWFVANGRVGVRRWVFLHETLVDLDRSLRLLGSRLLVLRGNPQQVFKWLVECSLVNDSAENAESLGEVVFERDTEPYANKRDQAVKQLLLENDIKCCIYTGHTLYDCHSVIAKNGGKTPTTYKQFCNLVDGLQVAQCSETPTKLPKVNENILQKLLDKSGDIGGPIRNFAVPGIEEMVPNADVDFVGHTRHYGGETEALARLQNYMFDKSYVANFEKPKTSPAAYEPASTTVLSPYLKFGSLSCRKFYHELQEVYRQQKKHSQPPVSLLGQLLWREFFYTASCQCGFHKMEQNPQCLQVNWRHHPGNMIVDKDAADFKAFCDARTGFPWIDAIMTQLRCEGWIHHLARHSVACFLTRGQLYISWERGVEIFDELLLDSDYALNNANWMWLSASAYFHAYYRVYSPVVFGRKYDPSGDYVKRYLPVLARVPSKYIYEPWLMSKDDQRKYGCVIGQDYPAPIVDHEDAKNQNLAKLKESYAIKLYGSFAVGRPTETIHAELEYENQSGIEPHGIEPETPTSERHVRKKRKTQQ